MCGRFSLGVDTDRLVHELDLDTVTADVRPRWNIAPTQEIAAVIRANGRLRLGMLRWGLVPRHSRGTAGGAPLINARSETVHRRPSFRDSFRARRCWIPADGFFEWRRGPQGSAAHHFRSPDGRPFVMAGIWDRWQGEAGETIPSCAILTTTANEVVRGVHERMPVILAPHERDRWLDPRTEQAELLALLRPLEDPLVAVPVSSRVNSVAHDDLACTAPLTSGDAGTPPLPAV